MPLMLMLGAWQVSGDTWGEVSPVADMHQRKAEMATHSDAFIALPGIMFHMLGNSCWSWYFFKKKRLIL